MDEMIKLMVANLPNFLGLIFTIWWMNRQMEWLKDEYAKLLEVLKEQCIDDDETIPSRD